MHESHTLYELQTYVRRAIALNFEQPLWIRAEVAEFNISGGHLYLGLVDKDQHADHPKAKADAVLWNKTAHKLKSKLTERIRNLLAPGTEASILVQVDFHQRYGYKLIIQDIDEQYALGHVERQRRMTLDQLAHQALLDRNGLLQRPMVFQRLAIIASADSAGYKDFIQQLSINPHSYHFHTDLYHSAVQGDHAPDQICQAITDIQHAAQSYDLVVILRGGGSKLDLKAFDHLEVCRAIAKCTIPVLTGIGHETDQSIADIVAAISVKTPTAAAQYILNVALLFETSVQEIMHQINFQMQSVLTTASASLRSQWRQIIMQAHHRLQHHQVSLQTLTRDLNRAFQHLIQHEHQQLVALNERRRILDPQTMISRGYAMVAQDDGTRVRQVKSLNADTLITLHFSDGQARAQTTEIRPN